MEMQNSLANNLLELCDRFKEEHPYTSEKLVELDSKGKVLVVGDIHADFQSLKHIYDAEKERLKLDRDDKIIHLGDYADRGNEPHLVYITTLSNALKYGENFVMLKGNHDHAIEVKGTLLPIALPFDLDLKLQQVFGVDKGKEVCKQIMKKIWSNLPYSALIEEKYWFVHGGIPTKGKREGTDVKRNEIENPNEKILWEMLWNDPAEGKKNGYSLRGYEIYTFGEVATRDLLNELNAKVVIRSHEPQKVLKVEHGGMVLTLGSCPNAYSMNKGAYLVIDLKGNVSSAEELLKFATIF
jgi:protein phosphatase